MRKRNGAKRVIFQLKRINITLFQFYYYTELTRRIKSVECAPRLREQQLVGNNEARPIKRLKMFYLNNLLIKL